MIADCTGLVLAGGESRRMGFDKTALRMDGQTLLQRAVERLRGIFPTVLVSVRQIRPDAGLPADVLQVVDELSGDEPAGPLAGLCAGLAEAKTPWVFVLAADMPFIAPAAIEYLAQQRAGYQAVVPMIAGHPQPLAAFYAAEALPSVRAVLAGEGKRSFRVALERLRKNHVNEEDLRSYDPGLRGFTDLDTPAEVAAAMHCGCGAMGVFLER